MQLIIIKFYLNIIKFQKCNVGDKKSYNIILCDQT